MILNYLQDSNKELFLKNNKVKFINENLIDKIKKQKKKFQ